MIRSFEPWSRVRLLFLLATALAPCAAHAHPPDAAAGDVFGGFVHPLGGPDHLLAALGAGLWAARLGRGGRCVLLAVFPSAVVLGCVAALAGPSLPGLGAAAALSAAAVGAMVVLRSAGATLLVGGSAALLGCIAFVQGAAHASGLPATASAVGHAMGLAITTGLVQLSGIGLAGMLQSARPRWAGAAVALTAVLGAARVAAF